MRIGALDIGKSWPWGVGALVAIGVVVGVVVGKKKDGPYNASGFGYPPPPDRNHDRDLAALEHAEWRLARYRKMGPAFTGERASVQREYDRLYAKVFGEPPAK